MPETVEGQDIALAILEGEADPGWEAFRRRYEAQLIRRAEGILRRTPTLRSFGQAEDLVQEFLVEQVISHPQAMLGPVARGEKPLWPRLSRSLGNYCIQSLRHLARHPQLVHQDAIEVEDAADAGDVEDRTETRIRIDRRVDGRQDAIRRAFTDQGPGGVPLVHLLLLSERLLLAQLIETTFSETDSRPSPEVPIPELVGQVAPWSEEEQTHRLPPKEISLGNVWDSLTRPMLRTDGDAIAQVLGVRRNTWDQWIHRARLRVLSHLGLEDCRRLFPHWPERLTGKTARPSGEQGGS
jgi:DNA-directed RNA polymerase specialized sigma24 family protein